MRTFTVAERRARLARRHRLAAGSRSTSVDVTAVTAAMIGLHATDPATPYLSLWARSNGFTTAHLDHELYTARSVVKHLAMRRTLWLTCAGDLASIQPAASDAVAISERRRLIADVEKAGVAADGAQWLDDACAAVLRYLADHDAADTSTIRRAVPELAGTYNPAPGKRWGGETNLAPRVFTVLSVRGDIVRSRNTGGWTTARPQWSTVAGWLDPAPSALPAEQARAHLVARWLWTFGPATVADLKWWFGTTLTSARQSLRDVGAVEVDMQGSKGFALADDLETEAGVTPWSALLPGLDVTTMGWFDRDWYLGEHRGQVFDRNGNGGPTAWWNGRIVGGWSQDARCRVQLQLLEDPGRAGRQALTRRAAELTAWLDGTRISPRFPSPLAKASPKATPKS